MTKTLFNKIQESVNYSTLSSDPELAWLDIFDTCMIVAKSSIDSGNKGKQLIGYKAIIDALNLANKALGLDISLPNSPSSTSVASGKMNLGALGYDLRATRNLLEKKRDSDRFVNAIRQRQSPDNKIESEDILLISNHTLVAIHPRLQALRNSVANVEMDEKKKNKLFDILNEFERELNTKSVSKSLALRNLAMVGAIIVGTTTFLAEAPAALQTLGEIQAHLGTEIQDAETLKEISQESKPALPAPKEV